MFILHAVFTNKNYTFVILNSKYCFIYLIEKENENLCLHEKERH